MTDIDPYPVSQLPARYNKSRDVIYKRLETLKITPQKLGKGNQTYIALEDLHRMDALHKHVQAGGKGADFVESDSSALADDFMGTGLDGRTYISDEQWQNLQTDSIARQNLQTDSIDQQDLQTDSIARQLPNMGVDQFLELASAIALHLHPPDPYANYETLERFAKNRWKMQTKDLKTLIGMTPRYSEIRWGGFIISREGRWWGVEKEVSVTSSHVKLAL